MVRGLQRDGLGGERLVVGKKKKREGGEWMEEGIGRCHARTDAEAQWQRDNMVAMVEDEKTVDD